MYSIVCRLVLLSLVEQSNLHWPFRVTQRNTRSTTMSYMEPIIIKCVRLWTWGKQLECVIAHTIVNWGATGFQLTNLYYSSFNIGISTFYARQNEKNDPKQHDGIPNQKRDHRWPTGQFFLFVSCSCFCAMSSYTSAKQIHFTLRSFC